jgi:hypothetical protein
MAHLRGVVVEREIYHGPQVVLDIESDADTHRVKHAVAVHRNRVNLPETRAVRDLTAPLHAAGTLLRLARGRDSTFTPYTEPSGCSSRAIDHWKGVPRTVRSLR